MRSTCTTPHKIGNGITPEYAVRLLELRKVKQVVRSGYRRDTKAWCSADYWIKVKVDGAQQYADSIYKQRLESCKDTGRPIWVNYDGNWPPPKNKDFNLRYYEVMPGQDTFVLGTGPNTAKVTLLHGLNKSPSSWDSDFPTNSRTRESRRRNAISLVAQLEYRGKTVLFTGDAVGHRGNNEDGCIATDRSLVEMEAEEKFNLQSHVLIAPHHGSSNGSCREFIKQVDPGWVVFPAGNNHDHPSYRAVSRYKAEGISNSKIFRTDRGDGELYEWKDGNSQKGCKDPVRDDDILIELSGSGAEPIVKYKKKHHPDPNCGGS